MVTEKRLIYAEAMKERFMKSDLIPKLRMTGRPVTDRIVDETPTVDAVDVVRCKDCTEWGGVPFGNVCRRWSAPLAGMKNCTGPDDYCSYGKRRTDNEVHSSDPCHL